MKRIWKFDLDDVALQYVEMPEGSRPLTVQSQADLAGGRLLLVLWAICDDFVEKKVKYPVWQYDTGDSLREGLNESCYLATVQLGRFVYHVFVGKPVAP